MKLPAVTCGIGLQPGGSHDQISQPDSTDLRACRDDGDESAVARACARVVAIDDGIFSQKPGAPQRAETECRPPHCAYETACRETQERGAAQERRDAQEQDSDPQERHPSPGRDRGQDVVA